MISTRPPLTGFNHNVRYRERIFHIQTEDSGVDSPHVFSHVFLDGAIVATLRLDYRDIVATEGHEVDLISRMKAQHKEMIRGLLRGDCDDRIRGLVGRLDDNDRKPAVKQAQKLEESVKRKGWNIDVITRFFSSIATYVYVGEALVSRVRDDGLGLSKEEVRAIAEAQHQRTLERAASGALDEAILGCMASRPAKVERAEGER